MDFCPIEDMVFVFGSNLAGRHGKGAAQFAAVHKGARRGVGVGRTGDSYALPTKDEHLKILTQEQIRYHVDEFLEYASSTDEHFMVTRFGCGLAGYCDWSMFKMFERGVPDNVHLPGVWRTCLDGKFRAAIFAGSRDYPAHLCDKSLIRNMRQRFEYTQDRYPDLEWVSGTARGLDRLGEQVAKEYFGLTPVRMPANWTRYSKASGHIRNQAMAWYATDLFAYSFNGSSGTQTMVGFAKEGGLRFKHYSIWPRERPRLIGSYQGMPYHWRSIKRLFANCRSD